MDNEVHSLSSIDDDFTLLLSFYVAQVESMFSHCLKWDI